MKELAFYVRKDYDLLSPRLFRHSIRAVIIKNGKIAMIYEKNMDYMFSPEEALKMAKHILTHLYEKPKKN